MLQILPLMANFDGIVPIAQVALEGAINAILTNLEAAISANLASTYMRIFFSLRIWAGILVFWPVIVLTASR